VKFYDFLDKQPAIGKLAIIEGTERVLAERALDTIVESVLPPDVRDLNLDRFAPGDLEDTSRLREAVQAMPFLAQSRLIVILDAQVLKTAIRRDIWSVAEAVPEGNSLVICDLLSPRAQRPQPFGAMAGRSALRIDTTANAETRRRFIEETLKELKATAEPRAIGALAESSADLSAIRNDLQKLALGGKKITLRDLEEETLSVEDPKAYKYAGALVEGRVAEALAIAREMFSSDRSAGVPLVYAAATECGLLWELARGGQLTGRSAWRSRALGPIAKRVGEVRARRAFERAVGAFDAIVTGRIEDPELAVEVLTAELAGLSAKRSGTA
jgi:DNA polymerase III delta subunit